MERGEFVWIKRYEKDTNPDHQLRLWGSACLLSSHSQQPSPSLNQSYESSWSRMASVQMKWPELFRCGCCSWWEASKGLVIEFYLWHHTWGKAYSTRERKERSYQKEVGNRSEPHDNLHPHVWLLQKNGPKKTMIDASHIMTWHFLLFIYRSFHKKYTIMFLSLSLSCFMYYFKEEPPPSMSDSINLRGFKIYGRPQEWWSSFQIALLKLSFSCKRGLMIVTLLLFLFPLFL